MTDVRNVVDFSALCALASLRGGNTFTRNAPVFIEIYCPREGVFAWSVTFDDNGLSQSGKVDSFPGAMECVADAVANAQIEVRA